MVPLFFYTHDFVIEEFLHYIKRIVYIFSQMNKKYPTLFLTWFNKFSRLPYPRLLYVITYFYPE